MYSYFRTQFYIKRLWAWIVPFRKMMLVSKIMLAMMNFGILEKWRNCLIRRNIAKSPVFLNGFIHGDGFYLLISIQNLNETIQIGRTTKQALSKLNHESNFLVWFFFFYIKRIIVLLCEFFYSFGEMRGLVFIIHVLYCTCLACGLWQWGLQLYLGMKHFVNAKNLEGSLCKLPLNFYKLHAHNQIF